MVCDVHRTSHWPKTEPVVDWNGVKKRSVKELVSAAFCMVWLHFPEENGS